MHEILNKLKEKKTVVSFYTDIEDTGSCYTGFVSETDDEYVSIAHISSSGLYDGYVLIKIEDIVHLETNGEYEEKIKKLYELKKQSHIELKTAHTGCLLDDLLEYCNKEKIFMSIELYENDEYPITGALLKNGEVLNIQVYDNYGKKDGTAYVRKSDIHTLSVDRIGEHNIWLLSLS